MVADYNQKGVLDPDYPIKDKTANGNQLLPKTTFNGGEGDTGNPEYTDIRGDGPYSVEQENGVALTIDGDPMIWKVMDCNPGSSLC